MYSVPSRHGSERRGEEICVKSDVSQICQLCNSYIDFSPQLNVYSTVQFHTILFLFSFLLFLFPGSRTPSQDLYFMYTIHISGSHQVKILFNRHHSEHFTFYVNTAMQNVQTSLGMFICIIICMKIAVPLSWQKIITFKQNFRGGKLSTVSQSNFVWLINDCYRDW